MVLLGCTGSIGVNTLAIAKRFKIDVEVLVAGENISLLNEQIKYFSPKFVVISNEKNRHKVNHLNVRAGKDAILDVIESSSSNLVVNALVGFLGLAPTIKAINCGKKVALANKESLVAGGSFIDIKKILPIDSEHFGLWYLLQDRPISKMIITASGGALRDWDLEKIKLATLADTQKHPNWLMGKKITIDSSTMVNKLFELLEARWLFGVGKYDAIIEKKSIIHAVINFKDGSSTAHLANTNMQLPIAYALDTKMKEKILEPINLTEIGNINFKKIDISRYPIWEIKENILNNPHKGVILNAANEAILDNFILGKCSYLDISKSILRAYEYFDYKATCIDEIFQIHKEVQAFVKKG